MFADDDGDDGDHDSMPDLMQAPPRQNPQHNPWTSDDPDETDISNLQFTQTAPGHFNVRATVTRSVSPQQFRAAGGIAPASIGGFMSMLTGLAGAAAQQGPGQTQGQGEGYFAGQNQNPNQSAFQEARSQSGDGQPQIRATRFTYSSGARLYSRDANNPEPRVEPVETMGE
jgi:E3 ubiquitin-protein ligase RNF115/126